MEKNTKLSELSMEELENFRNELPELTELELLNIVRLIRLKSRKARTLTPIPTPTDILIKKATEKVEQKAHEKEVKMVLKMINQNCDDEFIQDVTKMSIEEITKIREEYLKQ